MVHKFVYVIMIVLLTKIHIIRRVSYSIETFNEYYDESSGTQKLETRRFQNDTNSGVHFHGKIDIKQKTNKTKNK